MSTAPPASSCKSRYAVAAIIASAGGIPALVEILSALPSNFALPVLIAQHLPSGSPSLLVDLLARHTPLAVKWAEPHRRPQSGVIHVVRPGYQLEVSRTGFLLHALGAKHSAWLASADALLKSAAMLYGNRAIGVVLSGMLSAGSAGIRLIRRRGGITMAQSEGSASHFDMPRAAIDWGKADIVYPPARIAAALELLAKS